MRFRGNLRQKAFNLINFLVTPIKLEYQNYLERKKQFAGSKYCFMFHKIVESKIECDDDYSISKNTFYKMCELLLNDGVYFLTPDEYVDDNSDCTTGVLLSFDDAYEGVYKYVFPYCVEKHIPFIVFQCIDKTDMNNYLKKIEVEQMLEFPLFYLGSHTLTHPQLIYSKEKDAEIRMSKEKIKEIWKYDAKYFAYPYGSLATIGKSDIRLVKKNYKAAFATIQTAKWHKNSIMFSDYLLPRININEKNAYSIIVKLSKMEKK